MKKKNSEKVLVSSCNIAWWHLSGPDHLCLPFKNTQHAWSDNCVWHQKHILLFEGELSAGCGLTGHMTVHTFCTKYSLLLKIPISLWSCADHWLVIWADSCRSKVKPSLVEETDDETKPFWRADFTLRSTCAASHGHSSASPNSGAPAEQMCDDSLTTTRWQIEDLYVKRNNWSKQNR